MRYFIVNAVNRDCLLRGAGNIRSSSTESTNIVITGKGTIYTVQLSSYLHNQRLHCRLASLLLMSFHWVASKCTFLLQTHVCQSRRAYATLVVVASVVVDSELAVLSGDVAAVSVAVDSVLAVLSDVVVAVSVVVDTVLAVFAGGAVVVSVEVDTQYWQCCLMLLLLCQ